MLDNAHGVGSPLRFTTIRRLATVYWGDVQLAEQVGDGAVHKNVRVWTVRPELCRDLEAVGILREDLSRAGKLSPYSIAQLLDVWEVEESRDGLKAISFATEHLEGLTLREALDEAFYNDLDFQLPAIVAVALEIARALEYSHDRHSKARGLVHGDLRPELVLLGLEGAVKVAGFGLARFLGRVSPDGEWSWWKNRFYQPPERADLGAENPRKDLYSLGLIILEALCARPDLTGEELRDLLTRLETGSRMTMNCGQEVPADLAQVILRACSRGPEEDSYTSATQMATDLHLLLLERRHVRPTASIIRETVEDLVPGPDREKTFTDLSASIVDQEPLSHEFPSERMTLPDLPLVGRERELEQIAQAFEMTAASTGQVIVLRGEPGMGRTRLMNEVAARLVVSERKHAWLHIGSSPSEQGVQFSGVLRLLASSMGLRSDVDLLTVGQEAERLRAHGVEPAAIAAVRAVVGLESPPDRSQIAALISEALIRCVYSLSWEQATVVAWDDLHWADHASLGCILELMTRFSDMPAIGLVTTRKDFRPPWALPQGSTLIDLDPLPYNECERFVVQMGWGAKVAPTLLQALVQHTGGNPQLLEEVVDLLAETDRLEVRNNELILLGDPSSLPRLEDRIIERLDALDEDATFVAVTAAISGPALTTKLVSTTTGIPVESVVEILNELADVRGIVKRTRNGFDLRSERIKEAVIAAADPGLVRNVRRWVAKVITDTCDRPADGLDDHVATLLAESGDHRSAADVLVTAAKRQEARGDLRGAAERYARALQLQRATGRMNALEELALCMATGRTSVHSLSLELGEWALHRAVELADIEGDTLAGAEARVLLCRLLTRKGQLEVALERAREAVPLAKRSGDRLMVAQVCGAIAERYQQQGDFGHDMEYLENALRIATEIGDVKRIGEFLQLAVVHAVGVGEYERTRELLDQAKAIAREHSDPLLSCQLQKVEALLNRFSGDNEGALRVNLEGVAMAHAHGLMEQEIIMLHNCGDNHLFIGNQREALYFYSESLRRARAARYDRLTEANEMFVGFLEVTYLGVEAGHDRLRQSISSAERSRRLWNLNQGHRLLGQALLDMDNVESAVYHLREALRLAQETGVMFFIEQAAQWLEKAQRTAGVIQ